MLILNFALCLAPASSPRNVAASSLSSTKIKVIWEGVSPIDRNGIITMYEVKYTPLEDFGGVIGKTTQYVSSLEVILSGLQEYVNYNISVRANTSVGAGPYSDPLTILTNEDGMYC